TDRPRLHVAPRRAQAAEDDPGGAAGAGRRDGTRHHREERRREGRGAAPRVGTRPGEEITWRRGEVTQGGGGRPGGGASHPPGRFSAQSSSGKTGSPPAWVISPRSVRSLLECLRNLTEPLNRTTWKPSGKCLLKRGKGPSGA